MASIVFEILVLGLVMGLVAYDIVKYPPGYKKPVRQFTRSHFNDRPGYRKGDR